MEQSGSGWLAPRLLWVTGWMLAAAPWCWGGAGGGSVAAELGQKPSAYVGMSQDASVEGFLRKFERASIGNDANVKAELYAEQMDRYFLKTHVTREFVYRDLLDWLSRGRLITSFRLTVLSSEGDENERTLLVRKEAAWMDGGAMRTLATRSQFILRKVGSEWKIVSERDYKPGR